MWKRVIDQFICKPLWLKFSCVNALVLFVLGLFLFKCRICGFFTPPYFLFTPIIAFVFFRFVWKKVLFDKKEFTIGNAFIMSIVSGILIPYATEISIGIIDIIWFVCFGNSFVGISEPSSIITLIFSGFVLSQICWQTGTTIFILNMVLWGIALYDINKNR